MKRKMMRRMMMAVMALLMVSGAAWAVMFTWIDENGNYHATDRVEALPPHYRAILRYDVNHYTSPEGLGFERDEGGSFNFFDHRSPAKKKTRRSPPAASDTRPSGLEVTPEQLAEIKRRYLQSGVEQIPPMLDGKVMRIISADTFELDSSQKVTYIGIGFPEELKGDTKIHEEVINYQKRILQGRQVKLLFGPQRTDEKGRLLAFVFVGTDMFVNADLVMNGYARVHTVPPNTEYQALFRRLEDFAKKNRLGIWDTGSAGVDLGAPSSAASPPAPPPASP